MLSIDLDKKIKALFDDKEISIFCMHKCHIQIDPEDLPYNALFFVSLNGSAPTTGSIVGSNPSGFPWDPSSPPTFDMFGKLVWTGYCWRVQKLCN